MIVIEIFNEVSPNRKIYYKVTSNNIAKEAKVPIGSFYNYFGNKKGVLLELIKDFNAAFHADTSHSRQKIVEETTSQKEVLKNLERLFADTVLSAHLADPFYKIIHALQFTEADVLALSEEIRLKEIDFLIELLERIHQFHPLSNIALKAKIFHTTLENINLYIHHLGSTFEQQELIKETAKMFYAYLFPVR